MNTLPATTQPANRLAALALSAVFTLALLVSVDQLAQVDAPAAQMAHNVSTPKA